MFQDSFFAPDSRDGFSSSEFAPLGGGGGARSARGSSRRADASSYGGADTDSMAGLESDDVGGVVVDAPKLSSGSRR